MSKELKSYYMKKSYKYKFKVIFFKPSLKHMRTREHLKIFKNNNKDVVIYCQTNNLIKNFSAQIKFSDRYA